jgi:hypothetical protein
VGDGDGPRLGADAAADVPGRLPGKLRAGIEQLSGFDMSDVSVHRDSSRPASLGAHASAEGTNIFLAPGQDHHLPHEAWHVVQQKQGRVAATAQLKGIGVNTDDALEHEADEMGERAAAVGGSATPVALRIAAAGGGVAQLVAPGPITHVTNSCFAAALINIFTVTPSLKNLINPAANQDPLSVSQARLRNVLWRAVNTCDASQVVPGHWVRNIMTSLAENQVIASPDRSDDVNNVVALVALRLTPVHADAGQGNGMPAFGAFTWLHGHTIQQAFAALVDVYQPPNTAMFNRVGGPGVAAPQTWTYQIPHGGALVTYRRTSIIERNVENYTDSKGNTAEHFISIVDRSGAGTEWWRSDDVGPQVSQVNDPTQVMAPGAQPGPGKTSVTESSPSKGEAAKESTEPSSSMKLLPIDSPSKDVPVKTASTEDGSKAAPLDPLRSRLLSMRRAIDDDSDDDDDEDSWSSESSTDKTSSDKTSSEMTSSDKTSFDKASTDETPTVLTDKVSTTVTPSGPSTDKTSTDKTSTDKTSTDKTSTDKVSTDKVSTDKSSTDKSGEAQPGAPAAFNAETHGLTYVYQRADEAENGGGDRTQTVANSAIDQHAFDEQYLMLIAEHEIRNLDDDSHRNRAIRKLNTLMLRSQRVHERVASDNEVFKKMYVSIKEPRRNERFQFSGDPEVDKARRAQRIHAITDQLHYLLQRLGGGPQGMANNPDFHMTAGTEIPFHMTQQTAQAAQASALGKLIAQFAGEEVRMPVYSHRVGPMLGRLTEPGTSLTQDQYHKDAAKSLNAILTSQDPQKSNIRVTQANAGPGAYVATDSDNFYGPHGVAFDPRDLHQIPLSTKSTDNFKKHSSERTREQHHQFRALGEPIPFTEGTGEDVHPTVAEIFVGTHDAQSKDLMPTLEPDKFNPGVLPITIESVLRDAFRQHLGLAPMPTHSHSSKTHDQPKGSEEVYLMRELVIELEGLYEPKTWSALWENPPQESMLSVLSKVFDKAVGQADGTKSTGEKSSETTTKEGESSTTTPTQTSDKQTGGGKDPSSSDDDWETQ